MLSCTLPGFKAAKMMMMMIMMMMRGALGGSEYMDPAHAGPQFLFTHLRLHCNFKPMITIQVITGLEIRNTLDT